MRSARRSGLAQYASSRYEADDIIGTLTVRAQAAGMPVTIVSRDKDLTQLLSINDTYWDAIANVRYRHGDIEERFGATPERMADFLALMGDAVDNIPGVPGVGRKTAQKLLKHFDTLARRVRKSRGGQNPQIPWRLVRGGQPARTSRKGFPVATAHRHRL